MTNNRGDMPARPFEGGANNQEQPDTGLTIREQFAVAAMQGLLSDCENLPRLHISRGVLECPKKTIAMASIQYADALLAELERNQ